jgi:hypothetical protein
MMAPVTLPLTRAAKQSIRYRAYFRRESAAGDGGPSIYVTVSDVIRAKIILFAAEGLSNDVIAARLDTPRQIVSKWRKRFFKDRLMGLEEQARSGRPVRFSPQRGHRG